MIVSTVICFPTCEELTSPPTTATATREGDNHHDDDNVQASNGKDDKAKEDELSWMMDIHANTMV